jgi:pilus assembly protein Flp/PilA
MLKQMQAFMKDEDGVTAIEYGLIAALISIIAIAAMTTSGTFLNTVWGKISTALSSAAN